VRDGRGRAEEAAAGAELERDEIAHVHRLEKGSDISHLTR
jgi:hypothetical protein